MYLGTNIRPTDVIMSKHEIHLIHEEITQGRYLIKFLKGFYRDDKRIMDYLYNNGLMDKDPDIGLQGEMANIINDLYNITFVDLMDNYKGE